MSQQHQRKFYPCRGGCQTQVFFDNNHKSQSGKFIPLQLDSLGQTQRHDCPNRKPYRKQNNVIENPSGRSQKPATNSNNDLQKEITAIKAHLLGLVSRLDRIEQELGK
ncbi:MAG: hypothetical protein M3275_00200 [Thermoproteota archaeon]|nr:hypothetical protein [Thermoproteota archaeon]